MHDAVCNFAVLWLMNLSYCRPNPRASPLAPAALLRQQPRPSVQQQDQQQLRLLQLHLAAALVVVPQLWPVLAVVLRPLHLLVQMPKLFPAQAGR